MATKRDMTVDDHVRTALEFLEHADREFAADEILQGSEKLWGAASHAVTAIAKKRGWPSGKYNDRKIAVRKLSAEYDDSSLTPSFSVAHKFHANFYRDFMEDDDIAEDRTIVYNFVRRIVDMVAENVP